MKRNWFWNIGLKVLHALKIKCTYVFEICIETTIELGWPAPSYSDHTFKDHFLSMLRRDVDQNCPARKPRWRHSSAPLSVKLGPAWNLLSGALMRTVPTPFTGHRRGSWLSEWFLSLKLSFLFRVVIPLLKLKVVAIFAQCLNSYLKDSSRLSSMQPKGHAKSWNFRKRQCLVIKMV